MPSAVYSWSQSEMGDMTHAYIASALNLRWLVISPKYTRAGKFWMVISMPISFKFCWMICSTCYRTRLPAVVLGSDDSRCLAAVGKMPTARGVEPASVSRVRDGGGCCGL